MMLFPRIWVLAAVFPLAESRLASKADPSRKLLTDKDELFNVIVGYQESTGDFSEQGGVLASYRSRIRTEFERTNAVAMAVTLAEWSELEKDPSVAYIQEDSMVYPLAETTPWGIEAIQGTDDTIPLPSTENGAACFKMCVVDSGLMVGHPDIPFSLPESSSSEVDAYLLGKEFELPDGQFWYNPAPSASHGTHVTGTIIAAGGNDIGVVGVIPNGQNICLIEARVFGDDQSAGQHGSVIDSAAEWCASQGARVINMSLGSALDLPSSREIYQKLFEEGVLVIAASGNGGSSNMLYPASYDGVMSVAAVNASMEAAPFSQFNEQVDIAAPGQDVMSTVPGIRLLDDHGHEFSASIMEFSEIPTEVITGELSSCGLGFEPCQDAFGKVCLMERGEITFADKALNCFVAGGTGAVIFNNEDGPFHGTLGAPGLMDIPVMSMAREDGLTLLAALQASNGTETNVTETLEMNFNYATYGSQSGTSMASPHVAGVATKIWAARPQCSSAQIREALEKTAVDLGPAGRDNHFGHGLVQAVDAYEYLLNLPGPCGDASPELEGQEIEEPPTEEAPSGLCRLFKCHF